jgi:hypothetical protein
MHGTDAATGVQQARVRRQEVREGRRKMGLEQEEQPLQDGWVTLARWRLQMPGRGQFSGWRWCGGATEGGPVYLCMSGEELL